MTKHNTPSRKRTPWTGKDDATPLQSFIDTSNVTNYEKKHPSISDTEESSMLNAYSLDVCRYCKSQRIKKYGFTRNHVRRYRCSDCERIFTVTTGTIFDNHKIPISEWVDYLLGLFRIQSFNSVSKSNRNSDTTTNYWNAKLYLTLRGYQDNIILGGTTFIDETFYKLRKGDIQTKDDGQEYRGLSRNQICIGIGCDLSGHVFCTVEGHGKTSSAKTMDAFSHHIEPGSTLIHDMEKAHGKLVQELKLVSEAYLSKSLKELEDKDNPLNEINQRCRQLKYFLNSHSGFNRANLPDYLNLFAFIVNPPIDPYKKIEIILKRVFENPISLKYRDKYSN
jgi:transposase-like protein